MVAACPNMDLHMTLWTFEVTVDRERVGIPRIIEH